MKRITFLGICVGLAACAYVGEEYVYDLLSNDKDPIIDIDPIKQDQELGNQLWNIPGLCDLVCSGAIISL